MASVSFLQHSFTPLLYAPSQSRSSSGSSTRLKISSSSAIEAAPEIRLEGASSAATSWSFSLEEMMEAGVHFGHQARRWNPKMKPYIFTENKGIHILDLTQTARFLSEACDLVAGAASKGKQFLIVGTKYQAADIVASCAQKAQCHYVNHKWLGGMLTNWSTIETRLQRLKYLEEEKKGGYKRFQEKEAAVMERQLNQMKKNLGGIKYMANVPDIVIIVDQLKESIAVKECITLGIPTICLVDSNCDPDLADIPIPANDDSRSSISWILNKLTSAISEARIYNSKS